MSISDLYLATERRRQRQRGRRHRAADTANPNLTPRDTCNSCGQAGHRSSRSHDCPNHNLSVQQLMIQRFGQGYQTYTIKCGVNSVVKQEYRQRFVEGVNQLSLYTRKIIIRTQILVNTYLLQQDGDIPAICFEQQFFYSAMQIVQARRVTTTNSHVPTERLSQVWNSLLSEHPQLQTVVTTNTSEPSTVLSDCAVILATTYSNNIVLNLEMRITTYFLHRITSRFPVSLYDL